MAEIHILTPKLDAIGVGQLTSALTQAIEAGVDLGTRHHHIRAIGDTLIKAAQDLRREAALLLAGSGLSTTDVRMAWEALEHLAREVEKLGALANAYSS